MVQFKVQKTKGDKKMPVNYEKTKKELMELVQLKLKDVLLNAIYESITLVYTGIDQIDELPEGYFDCDTLNTAKQKLKDLLCQLPDALKQDTDSRVPYITQLTTFREQLVADFYKINLYLYRLQQIKDLYTIHIKLTAIDFNTDTINQAAFLAYVETLTQELEKLDEQGAYMLGELISLFPLRMTKDKYSDYISKGLKELLSGLNGGFLENTVKMFKAKVNPLGCEEYGSIMPYIKDSMEAIAVKNISELSSDELEKTLEELEEIEENLAFVIEEYSVLYNVITYLTAFSQFCINDEYIFENDLKLKDMLFATVEMLKNNSYDTMAEQIVNTVEDMIENIFEELKPFEKSLDKAITKLAKEDNIPEDIEISLGVYNTLMSTFAVEIIDEISGINNNQNSNMNVDAAVREIVAYVDNSLTQYPLPQQKLIKQRLLADMPSPYSCKEAYEYMCYAFDGITDNKKKLVCMGDILELTDSADDNECDCGHDHHHDCDCGHDHHHDCDCGHDHHHNCDCEHHH